MFLIALNKALYKGPVNVAQSQVAPAFASSHHLQQAQLAFASKDYAGAAKEVQLILKHFKKASLPKPPDYTRALILGSIINIARARRTAALNCIETAAAYDATNKTVLQVHAIALLLKREGDVIKRPQLQERAVGFYHQATKVAEDTAYQICHPALKVILAEHEPKFKALLTPPSNGEVPLGTHKQSSVDSFRTGDAKFNGSAMLAPPKDGAKPATAAAVSGAAIVSVAAANVTTISNPNAANGM